MLLTRMALNPARRCFRELVASPHRMHAAVLAAFPPDVPTSESSGRVLWRVDRGAGQQADLYLASPDEPDLTHLAEQAGWPTRPTWETRDYAPLLARLAAGQRWAFRLTANPVRRARPSVDSKRRLSAHVTAGQQRDWLLVRAAGHGFAVPAGRAGAPDVVVRERRIVQFRRDEATVTLALASYEGVLEVTDPERFRSALVQGIGRAKGYGCGLLTLAPLTPSVGSTAPGT